MNEALTAFLLVAGSLFVLVAAIGVVRLPDVLCRMHAATKAGAFGAALMLLAAALHLGDGVVWVKAVLVIVFFYVTAPIAGHLLGRAAYRMDRRALHLNVDEWAGRPGRRSTKE